MNRVRIFVPAAAGTALAALAWFLANVPCALPSISTDMVSRSVGVALLGMALIAAGAVFRAAMRAERKSASIGTRPQAREYRNGFRVIATKPPPVRRALVVSLRRAAAEQMSAAIDTG